MPGRAACRVIQVGSLTEKWHFYFFIENKSHHGRDETECPVKAGRFGYSEKMVISPFFQCDAHLANRPP